MKLDLDKSNRILGVLSDDEYTHALSNITLSDKEIACLNINYYAPNHTIASADMAQLMNEAQGKRIKILLAQGLINMHFNL